jgi:class 3 adenylate cyclase
MIFDNLTKSRGEARFSMYTTLFVTFLLVVGTYFFSSDVNRLIIGPIERLVDLVRKISANPLGVEYKMLGEKEGFLKGMETTILLTTINKIGGLMQVGFGEAGATVIAKNLADSSGGRLNLTGGGTMIQSIFGFCDIRQFTDTTECLQEEVMLFVNRIAFILHDIVVQCAGSANKNIGDAFLLAWKIDDKMSENQISVLADKALLSFLKTYIEISRHQKYICAFSPRATERLLKRFPNYNVRIGSGLHVGWAIEGIYRSFMLSYTVFLLSYIMLIS